MPLKTKRRPSVSLRLQMIALVCLAAAAILVVAAAFMSEQERSARSAAEAASFTPAPIATAEKPPVVAFLGDSYTAGDGAGDRALRWTTQLTRSNGWVEINAGYGGTGYGTAGRLEGGEPYFERVDDFAGRGPGTVIVSGGRNDLSENTDPAVVTEGITRTFNTLREELPNAEIIALSPLWDDDPAPAGLMEIGNQVKGAVEAVNGTYIDLGQPLEGRADLLGDDGVHPKESGYTYLFETISAALP